MYDTTPRALSMFTVVPFFKILVALATLTITGISNAIPIITTYESRSDCYVIIPGAF